MPKKINKKNSRRKEDIKMVRVNSMAYGPHERAARGTKSPAPLNKVLTMNKRNMTALSPVASGVHDILTLYSGFFKESMFWQKMMQRIHANKSHSIEELFNSLAGMELNDSYRLARFINLPEISTRFKKATLQINLACDAAPFFRSKDKMYRYTVAALFFTGEGRSTGHSAVSGKWFDIKETIGKQSLDFKLPAKSVYYIICLRLQTGVNGIATDTLASQGMQIVATGKIKIIWQGGKPVKGRDE